MSVADTRWSMVSTRSTASYVLPQSQPPQPRPALKHTQQQRTNKSGPPALTTSPDHHHTLHVPITDDSHPKTDASHPPESTLPKAANTSSTCSSVGFWVMLPSHRWRDGTVYAAKGRVQRASAMNVCVRDVARHRWQEGTMKAAPSGRPHHPHTPHTSPHPWRGLMGLLPAAPQARRWRACNAS